MLTPLREPTEADLIAATETNYAAYFAGFTILPQMQLWREADYTAFVADSAPGSTVLATRFTAATADAKIHAVLARLTPLVRQTWWQVLPASQPTDLATRLLAAGLTELTHESRPVMTLALAGHSPAPTVPPTLTIHRVSDANLMADWTRASALGFEASPTNVQPYHDAYSALGFAEDAPWQHFVGYVDGAPVTSATLLLAGGLAGVYDVSTAPVARRQGLGGAITRACLAAAQARGLHHAVLQASAEGVGVYARLGFRELYRERNFGWTRPATL
ncbi:MAG: GNAT family N-acetyltransferase [Ktedonobacterales bacterium]|nr:GNAT family N-acetyltransferase [Ktedonobacterales bacterium]